MMAAITANFQNVKYWLEKFPNWNVLRQTRLFGAHALGLAVISGPRRVDLVKYLLNVVTKNKISHIFTKSGNTLLMTACQTQDSDPNIVKLLIDYFKEYPEMINRPCRATTFLWRFIFTACRIWSRLKRHINVNAIVKHLAHNSGSTPLHEASMRGDIDTVNILLRHGADPSIRSTFLSLLYMALSFSLSLSLSLSFTHTHTHTHTHQTK